MEEHDPTNVSRQPGPICGTQVAMNFRPEYLRTARPKKRGHLIEMWPTCHDERQQASQTERQQLQPIFGEDGRLGYRKVEPDDNNSDSHLRIDWNPRFDGL